MVKEQIKEAVKLIHLGELVAFPTETVYGLGADATNDKAVAKIFALKNRPKFNPLIVHFSCAKDVFNYAIANERAKALAKKFWPGPLTMVLARGRDTPLSLLVSAGLDTVAVRVPKGEIALELLKQSKCPVAAPSANKFGSLSPTCAEHVKKLSDSLYVLDGGFCEYGVESTIVDVSQDVPILLRPGAITLKQLQDVVGPVASKQNEAGKITAPGQSPSHYAPSLPVRLKATYVRPDEALLAFGHNYPMGAKKTLNLSTRGDLMEAAAHLFAMLHELDKPEYSGIAISPIPHEGIGVAINDRLQKAAVQRPLV